MDPSNDWLGIDTPRARLQVECFVKPETPTHLTLSTPYLKYQGVGFSVSNLPGDQVEGGAPEPIVRWIHSSLSELLWIRRNYYGSYLKVARRGGHAYLPSANPCHVVGSAVLRTRNT